MSFYIYINNIFCDFGYKFNCKKILKGKKKLIKIYVMIVKKIIIKSKKGMIEKVLYR